MYRDRSGHRQEHAADLGPSAAGKWIERSASKSDTSKLVYLGNLGNVRQGLLIVVHIILCSAWPPDRESSNVEGGSGVGEAPIGESIRMLRSTAMNDL